MSVRSGKGDGGFTDLLFQRRVSKDSPYICAMGDLDELSSVLGIVKVKMKARNNKDVVERIQRAISVISSEIAIGEEKKRKNGPLLGERDTDWIKGVIYELERKTDLKSCFYIPGGNEEAAFVDLARAVARRAERSVVALFLREKTKPEHALTYLNCVSDALYIMARRQCKRAAASRRKTPNTGKRGRTAR